MDIGHTRARPTRKTAEMDRVGTGTHGHTRKGYTITLKEKKNKDRAVTYLQRKRQRFSIFLNTRLD